MSQPGNPAHDAIAKRLARIAGHAASLKRLWDENCDEDDMLTQIAAVRAALDQVGRIILEQHIEECVAEAVTRGTPDEAITELKAALERFIH
jgi:CsoR family transcriptional regulator, copper-sensing transcriptional repressor